MSNDIEGTGADFEELYNEWVEAYDAASSSQRWQPTLPEGVDSLSFDVAVTGVQRGSFQDKNSGGKTVPFWAIYGTMLTGEYEGKEWQLSYITPRSFFVMKTFCQVVSGSTPSDLKEADVTVQKAVDDTVLMRVTLKRKGVHVNVYFDHLLEGSGVEEVVEEVAEGDVSV